VIFDISLFYHKRNQESAKISTKITHRNSFLPNSTPKYHPIIKKHQQGSLILSKAQWIYKWPRRLRNRLWVNQYRRVKWPYSLQQNWGFLY